MIEHIIGAIRKLSECHTAKSVDRIQLFKLIQKDLSELNSDNLDITNVSKKYDYVRNGKNTFNAPILAVKTVLNNGYWNVTMWCLDVHEYAQESKFQGKQKRDQRNYFELIEDMAGVLKGIYKAIDRIKVTKCDDECKFNYWLPDEDMPIDCIVCAKVPRLPEEPNITEECNLSYHCLAGAKTEFKIKAVIGCNYVAECKEK